jgi:hypothetical protein
MAAASSHMHLCSMVESTQRVYGVKLFFVSARTNKRHHHHHVAQRIGFLRKTGLPEIIP